MERKTFRKVNYNHYVFSMKEKIFCGIQIAALTSLINYLCYRSLWFYICAIPISIIYFKWMRKQKIDRRKKKIKYQFQDVLHSLQTAVRTGYSMEQAIKECKKEMILIYGTKEDWITELDYMEKQMTLGVPIEQLLVDLGRRTYIEDIREFGDIFMICRRSGGNLGKVLEKCEQILGEKIRTEQEIEVTIAGKKFEQMIMSCIPAVMILYMQFTSEGFLAALYHNVFGVIVMSMCLVVYFISFWMGRKLVRFQI